jgi:hypothetical protein
MKKGQPLGLDEIMIVNPNPAGSGVVFLGEDGILYQVQGLGQVDTPAGVGPFFLGEDGTLYQAQGLVSGNLAGFAGLGRFFLGEDGTLFEVVR